MNDPKTPWKPWQLELARGCAIKFASALTNDEKGLGEKYNYLAYAEQNPPFEPHPWVLVAIAEAYELGKLAGEAEGRKTGDFVAEQQAEQHNVEINGAVRATIATMMEALDEGGPGIPYVTLDPKNLATIYDRVTLDFHQEEDGRFTYRMFRGANAPVPSIAPLKPSKLAKK